MLHQLNKVTLLWVQFWALTCRSKSHLSQLVSSGADEMHCNDLIFIILCYMMLDISVKT